ncbi:hypothetical protein LMG33818_000016 [Halomonadaceae bacterium LMG 33818]|uniref:phage antirepressor KilAC domain-containing protein n=1 Tax=Cernens ardua TaxID=3402176 RepID=UPI003EDC10BA
MKQIIEFSKLSMDSTEISELVESRHDKVKQSIERLAARGVIELPPVGEIKTSTKPIHIYVFEGEKGRRDSLVVVAQLSPEFTGRLVDRWQELEEKVSKPLLPDFSNPVEAARAWADAKESEMKAIEAAQAAKPAVEFVDRYVKANNSKSIRETAKILRIPEKQFIQQLIDDKILYRQSGNLLPHQKHHNAGRFSVKTGEANGHAYTQTRVTGEGIDYLANAYGYMIGTAA